MTKTSKVRITRIRQQHSAQKTARPGKAYNGVNLVAQRSESSKKAARKSTRRPPASLPTT